MAAKFPSDVGRSVVSDSKISSGVATFVAVELVACKMCDSSLSVAMLQSANRHTGIQKSA